MRRFSRVAPTLWTGETGKALRRRGFEALLVANYLLSSPMSNMLGLYYQPVLFAAHETGLGIEGASKGLRDCIECGFCKYDEATEMVWVINMALWQVDCALKPTDKRVPGIQKEYNALPDNPFLGEFFELYAEAFHMCERRDFKPLKSSSLPMPLQAPSKALRSQEQEQEQEQEQDLKPFTAPSALVVDAAATNDPRGDFFEPPSSQGSANVVELPGLPDCPTEALVAEYAAALPTLPQVCVVNDSRRRSLRARWREVCAAEKFDRAKGLDWFRWYFGMVATSDFLMGRVRADRDGRVWHADFDWLINARNFARVVDGRYHERRAQR